MLYGMTLNVFQQIPRSYRGLTFHIHLVLAITIYMLLESR